MKAHIRPGIARIWAKKDQIWLYLKRASFLVYKYNRIEIKRFGTWIARVFIIHEKRADGEARLKWTVLCRTVMCLLKPSAKAFESEKAMRGVEIDQKYFNMEIEPLLGTPQIRELQWRKLKESVRFSYEHVPFDRERMQHTGVTPDDIRSFVDFANAIPIASQSDYRDVYERFATNETGMPDMDMVLNTLFGMERLKTLYLMTYKSGTTGMPTAYPVFHQSTEMMREVFGRIGWRAGLRPGTRLAICYGLSMYVAGVPHLFYYKDLPGVTLFPIGAEAGSERILHLMKLFKLNAFAGTPSLALYLIERAPEVLGTSIRDLGIQVLVLGDEPGAGIPGIRKRLETEYGAKVFDVGAGYGCSCDYPEYQGMHWVADDYCYYELVDPVTHAPIPMEHGAKGLAVFTPLDPLATVFFSNLRFTMNDIHQVFTDLCPCGYSGFRYKIVGRADDMLKIQGVAVYPNAIQGVLAQFVPQVTGAFRIVLDEPPPRVVPPLKLKIERGENLEEDDLSTLAVEIQEKMHAALKVCPEITWLAPNTLSRTAKKTPFFEKAYENKGEQKGPF